LIYTTTKPKQYRTNLYVIIIKMHATIHITKKKQKLPIQKTKLKARAQKYCNVINF